MRYIANLSLLILFTLFYGCTEIELQVNNGTGSGTYEYGNSIHIEANQSTDPSLRFYKWEGDTSSVVSVYSEKSRISPRKKSIEVTATYINKDERIDVTVEGGKGGGSFSPGDVITIESVVSGDKNLKFLEWSGDTKYLFNYRVNKQEFRVYRDDIFLKALFSEFFKVEVKNGSGSGEYAVDAQVTVNAYKATEGNIFEKWIGDANILKDENKSSQIFTMPSHNIKLEATYKEIPKPPVDPPATEHFNIILFQDYRMPGCGGCAFYFHWQDQQKHKPKLVVDYEYGGQKYQKIYQHGLDGMDNAHGYYIDQYKPSYKHVVLVKNGPSRSGLFKADMSDIPIAANITSANLHLHFHNHEGHANADKVSYMSVYECTKDWDWNSANWTQYAAGKNWDRHGGDKGEFIRFIKIKEDVYDRGFSKGGRSTPSFDFTDYAKKVHAKRK